LNGRLGSKKGNNVRIFTTDKYVIVINHIVALDLPNRTVYLSGSRAITLSNADFYDLKKTLEELNNAECRKDRHYA
jgi:uncharacterized membrane protein YfbV (UPF0208 family)